MLKISSENNFHGLFFDGNKMEMEEESQICPECGDCVPTNKIKKHNQRRHDKRQFQCDECGVTTVGYEKHQSHKVCKLLNIFQYSC